ncbi:MAG: hypothetical protein IKR04_04145 [Clostridia bacterium]|nr:hypothetical protein [Clostridia bacterium]
MGEMNQLTVVGSNIVEVVKNTKNVAIVVVGIVALGFFAMKNGYGMKVGNLELSKNF